MDVGLPGFDGYQLARRVRGSAGPSIYLVALTGYGQPDDRRQAMEAGFDAHLVKPVNPDALLAAIHTAGTRPEAPDMPITVTPLSPCFAARIDGADISRPLDDGHVGGHPRRLRRALGAALPRRRRSTTRRRSRSACASARSRSPAA